jgi:hypothetical protein
VAIFGFRIPSGSKEAGGCIPIFNGHESLSFLVNFSGVFQSLAGLWLALSLLNRRTQLNGGFPRPGDK